jgi:alpha-N-arabinofuranosidase
MHDNPCGDDRYYNNLFVKKGSMRPYDKAQLPVFMDGNVFLDGARPSKHEANPLVMRESDAALRLVEEADGYYLEGSFDKAWAVERTRKSVTTELLGRASIPALPYENSDGSPLVLATDYLGVKRNEANPYPGPFELPDGGKQRLKVWPVSASK